jgi:hypothetical protein
VSGTIIDPIYYGGGGGPSQTTVSEVNTINFNTGAAQGTETWPTTYPIGTTIYTDSLVGQFPITLIPSGKSSGSAQRFIRRFY